MCSTVQPLPQWAPVPSTGTRHYFQLLFRGLTGSPDWKRRNTFDGQFGLRSAQLVASSVTSESQSTRIDAQGSKQPFLPQRQAACGQQQNTSMPTMPRYSCNAEVLSAFKPAVKKTNEALRHLALHPLDVELGMLAWSRAVSSPLEGQAASLSSK